jgi:hypothetical protein
VSPVEGGQRGGTGSERRREVHPAVVAMKRQLPAEGSRNRDRDRAIVCLDIDVEERARLYRRRMDMLPNNQTISNGQGCKWLFLDGAPLKL